MQADDIALIVTVAIALMSAFGWIIGPLHRIRTARKRARTTHWYEVVPKGVREGTTEQLESGISSWISVLRTKGKRGPIAALGDRMRNAQPGVVIHRMKHRGVLRTYLGVYDSPKPQAIADALARAVAGQIVACEPPEIGDGARMIGRREGFDPLDSVMVEEPHKFADFLAERLDDDACFSLVVEPVVRWEMKRLRAFLHVEEQASAGVMGSMGTLGPATARATSDRMVRMMVVGTGEDAATASDLVLSFGGHLDSFVQSVRPELPSDFNRAVMTASVLSPMALIWWRFLDNLAMAVGVLITCAALLLLAGVGIINLTRAEINSALNRSILVPQTPQWLNPRWSFAGLAKSTLRDRNAAIEGRQKAGRVAHPHPRRLLVATARQMLGLAYFPSEMSTAVASATTQERNAPQAVTVRSGIRAGIDPKGAAVWLPEPDRQWGVFAVGDPGTGKTTWLMNLYWSDLVNRKVALHEGRVGKSIFWIETKGEGAARAMEIARSAHYTPNEIAHLQAAATTGPRLDLVDWTDPNRGATLLVEMMRYAFDEGDIREQAAGVLHAVFRLAIACPEDVTNQLGFRGSRPNVIRLAFWLLGGEPHSGMPEKAIQLLQEAAARDVITADASVPTPAQASSGFAADFGASTPNNEANVPVVYGPVAEAWKEFSRYLPPHMSKRDAQNITESSRNKLQSLLSAPAMWEPDPQRPEVTLRSLVAGGWPAILNFGPPGGNEGPGFAELVAQRLAAMAMYALWDSMKQVCDGWQAQGRAIAIYSDELKDIAGTGTGGDVIRDMADQGRSRGVQPVFATQRPTQLPDLTRESVMSFGTRVYFRLEEVETAEAASTDLSGGRRGGFTSAEIRDLPTLNGACRMRRDGKAQAAFTIRALPDNWLSSKTWDSLQPPNPWQGDDTESDET